MNFSFSDYKWIPFSLELKRSLFPEQFQNCTMNTIEKQCSKPSKQGFLSKKKTRAYWDDTNTLHLIHSYKKHLPLFQKSPKRADEVWQMIASSQKNHSIKQLKQKWKNLKKEYTAAFDATTSKKTGEGADDDDKWRFYDEMHEVLKDDPKFKPVSVAGSSRGSKNMDSISKNQEQDLFGDENDNPTTNNNSLNRDDNLSSTGNSPFRRTSSRDSEQLPFAKKTKVEAFLMKWEEKSLERERGAQKRHDERMILEKKAVDIFQAIADTFKDVVSKNKD